MPRSTSSKVSANAQSDPPASGTVTIEVGKTRHLGRKRGNGELCKQQRHHRRARARQFHGFTGQIVGFTGDGTIANSDLLDLSDGNITDVVTSKTTYTENGNGTGTLTLYNATGQAPDSINFVGQYQLANFTIENDGAGHTLIVDPPISSDPSGAGGQSVASLPDQTLTGFAFGDNFVFNFARATHNTPIDIHPDSDNTSIQVSEFCERAGSLECSAR